MGLITKTSYITFVVIVIFSSEIASFEPSRVLLPVGKLGVIEFEYLIVPNGEVQLTIGHRQPFYDAGTLDDAGLSESQKERFFVEPVNDVVDKLLVKISNVSTEDAGTFNFYLLVNRVIQESYRQQKIVDVSIPPGKAFCRPVFDVEYAYVNSVEEIWITIECFASLGTEPGLFECYQNGEQTPFLTERSQNETTLMQKVVIKRSIPIYCCTSTVGEPKRRCGCNDYIWDPVTHVRSHGLDPCLPTTSVQGTALTDSTIFTTSSNIHSKTPTSGDVTYIDQDDQTATTGHSPEDIHHAFIYLKLITGISAFTVVLQCWYLLTRKNQGNYDQLPRRV